MDNVNSPSHYLHGSIETIEVIKSITGEGFKGYLAGSVIKYLSRYPYKDNPIQDVKKCQWYINRLLKELESKEIQR